MEKFEYDLQFFTEGEGTTPDESDESAKEGSEEQKTYTEEQLKSQINAVIAKERAKNEAEKTNKIDLAVKEALEKQKKLSELDDNGKQALELAEEKEKRQLLEEQIKQTEIKTEALKIFQDRNIPIRLLDYALSETAEQTLVNINEIETIFKEAVQNEVKTLVKGVTPSASTGAKTTSFKDINANRITL